MQSSLFIINGNVFFCDPALWTHVVRPYRLHKSTLPGVSDLKGETPRLSTGLDSSARRN